MVWFAWWLSHRSRTRSQSVCDVFCFEIFSTHTRHSMVFFSLLFRSLLGDSHRHLYDCYKRSYGEMLFRWNLLVARAKILKYLSVNTEIYRDVEYVTECTSCAHVVKAPLCKECRKPLLKCVLCRLPVKGLANACLNCGHGGHTHHMKIWFSVSPNSIVQIIFKNF